MKMTVSQREEYMEMEEEQTQWSVWPNKPLYNVLKNIEKKKDKRTCDFALQRNRRLHVCEKKSMTCVDAGLREGQILTVIFQELKSKTAPL